MTKFLTWFSALSFTTAIVIALILTGATQNVSAGSLVTIDDLYAGDLIRGESYSAVYYYGKDGFRYVFPNDKTYFTWYDNFDGIKWLSDSNLAKIQIGSTITYKPGNKMIKINSDSKTYAVGKNGTLMHVSSEEIAIGLYGSNWNTKIDDVPDAFFASYTMGSPIEFASQFSPSAEIVEASSIGTDKGLTSATIVDITESGFNPTSTTISAGSVIRFENNTNDKHGVSADNTKWGTGTMNGGESFLKKFDEPGTYSYHDKYDSQQTGTIIVQ